ncbi:hypothetical protein G3N95_34920 [Paraburkholderia sp. Tr-20389]|uniref:phage tail protein n=1 Tax=Paraburkholderia sp. Tr-20389 TaxID=2703903 RepID=UPI00197DBCA3|nr:phage tail protein [Paraburkholderia sp. Tr-20389]MBN3758153.1 hypothetical protein [Paraburkholderia sp. Tr-20389]
MERTNEVRLYGVLGMKFGRRHAFVIDTARQALNALVALQPGFAQELSSSHERALRYAVFVGETNLTLTDLDRPTGGQPVRVVPVIAGSKSDGLWQTIGGVALFSAGAVSMFWSNPYAYYMMGLGASLALGGVAQMISPHLPGKNHPVLQAQNVVSEGGPVPLLYGRMRVGSMVVSAGSWATDLKPRVSREATEAPGAPWDEKPAADSLISRTEIEIVDLISEGPIEGLANVRHPLRSVYFDGVSLENTKGVMNFDVIHQDLCKGEADQRPLEWLDAISCETAVGVQLHKDTPWILDIAEPDVDEVAITLDVRGLYRKDRKSGEQPSKIECQLTVASAGGTGKLVSLTSTFEGVCRQQYERTIRVDLTGIRARRYRIHLTCLTDYRTKDNKPDPERFGTVHVKCYAKRRNVRLRYPMSAIAAFRMSSERMRRVPVRTYDMKGLLVRVPSNYDPERRTYAGEWDGTFKRAWSNNPAWVFYDMLLNKRYGAGNWIEATTVDRYLLYEIGRYCDELVPDGRGGEELRFTCNCYITSRTHAFALLQQLASVFRGMAYWSGGTVMSVADKPQDPAHVYVPANVIDGEFQYMGSSLKTRYTIAMVSWHDPDNAYRESVESVEDAEGVTRYGANKVEVSAFGCTSRGQAQRVGYWYLLTSRLETDTVVFSVGLDGACAQPGQVIAICDPARSMPSTGGRIKRAQANDRIVLDRAIEANALGTFKVVMPDGKVEGRGIKHAETNIIELDRPLSALPVEGAVWLHESASSERRLFRVASVSESEDGMLLRITATQHDPEKFARVDAAAMIDIKPEARQPAAPVRNLITHSRLDPRWKQPYFDISWDAVRDASEYTVWCKPLSASPVMSKTVHEPHLRLSGLSPGHYIISVVVTLLDGRRSPSTAIQTVLHGAAYPAGLRVSAEAKNFIILQCDTAGDVGAITEVEYAVGETGDFGHASRSRFRGPAPFRLKGKSGFAWVRLRYMVGVQTQWSEWYPPETAQGVPLQVSG